MDGYLPVKVNVPLEDYRRLYAEAHAADITVAERIAQVISPPPKARPRSGRPSEYTTEKGEEMVASRRLGKSWAAVGREFGVDHSLAKRWAEKYLNEVREQNMRDRAERTAS